VSEHNDPGRDDDAALAEYLKGGSVVSQRYRETAVEAVPPNLDERVLKMAHAAVETGGASRWRRRGWVAPLALAASAVLVVSIVIESGVHRGEDAVAVQAPAPRAEAPAADASAELALQEQRAAQTFVTSAEAPQPAAPVAPAERAKEAEKVAADAQRAQRMLEQTAQVRAEEQNVASPPAALAGESGSAKTDIPAVVVSAPARRDAAAVSTSPVAADATEVDQVIVTGAEAARDVPRSTGPRNTVRPARSRDEEPAAAAEAPRTPEAWLEDIRDLRRRGREREADEEWDRFRKAHPDYAVPESDIARKTQ
jgi:hypothetical protein